MRKVSDIIISRRLATASPNRLERPAVRRSAVALVLDSDVFDHASVLLIQRAESENDPWSGHMAFPGGRKEEHDKNSLHTAKREMQEEVGFNIDQFGAGESGRVLGRLSDIDTSKRVISSPMIVSPYVFQVDTRPDLIPNYEVADTIWVPLNYFADLNNRATKRVELDNEHVDFPCYHYDEGKVIWGMTLKMLDELLGIVGRSMPAWGVER